MVTPKSTVRPFEILLVEDNPGDIRLIQEALKEGAVYNHLNVVNDGENALAFLNQATPYEQAPDPDLILLDLNIPRRSGLEVLETIKDSQPFRHIPVIIFTSSEAEDDIVNAYNLHANCYITKPINLEQFTHSIQSIESFWLAMVQLPSN